MYNDNNKVGFRCQHDSCNSYHWKDFRLKIEPDCYTAPKSNKKAPLKELPILGDDLMAKNLKPLEYLIDGFLTTSGVYLLAGASKMGKSWLSIDMSIAISNGITFFNKHTQGTPTLYIDLESSERSLKSRLDSMFKNGTNLNNWSCIHTIDRIGEGFEENIIHLIKEYNFKLIIVDVFVKIRSIMAKGLTEYQHDYSDLGVLKQIAKDHNVCFLIVTHLRKMKDDDDVFNTMTGSTGLMGASDGALLLARKRGEDTRWKYLGRSEDVQEVHEKRTFNNSPIAMALSKLLDDNDGEVNISA